MHKMIRGIWKKGNDRNPPDGRSAEVAGTSSCSPTVTTIILTITIIIAIMMMTMIRTLWTTHQCKDLTWLLTVWLIANHSFHLLLTRCHHYRHHHDEDFCVKQKDKPILQSSMRNLLLQTGSLLWPELSHSKLGYGDLLSGRQATRSTSSL